MKEFFSGQRLRQFPGGTVSALVRHVRKVEAQGPPEDRHEGDAGVVFVLIKESIAACIVSNGLRTKLVEVELMAEGQNGKRIRGGEMQYVTHGLPDAVDVPEDNAVVGIVVAGVLVNCSCNPKPLTDFEDD